VVYGRDLNRAAHVAERLYSERRLNGDEYRDLAQMLQGLIDGAFELEEDDGREDTTG
jgi:hypothetical protein